MNSGASLLDEAMAAHGGLERWQSVRTLRVPHSAGGFAFAMKFQGRSLPMHSALISTDVQRTVFPSYPGPGRRAVFERGVVRIETDDGRLVAQRLDARSDLHRVRHRLWWDRLDLLYFTGSAMWNYLVAPFIFASPGFEVHELDPWEERGEVWRRLAVTFPPEIRAHAPQQVFYFGTDGLLRRQDYTTNEFGAPAKAAHYSYDYREFGGLMFPTRRRVFPRKRNNHPRGRPLLVWIDIQAVEISQLERPGQRLPGYIPARLL